MRKLSAFGALALVVAIGGADSAAVANQEPIYQISEHDAEMNAAKREAIAGLPGFYARFADPAADESEFMIKFDILPGDGAEFVWATNLDRSTSPMTGVLLNQPELTEHRIGQRVPIAEVDIIDWSYRKGRVMQGGFTNRVLLRHMSPEDAAAMRQYFGW